ncbi:unnamed protein product [Closterium sp. Yama58-4]|nr:unnamed protein product [Closterium sp. Yama58-4]
MTFRSGSFRLDAMLSSHELSERLAFHSGGSSARSQKISNPRDRRSLFTEPFWRQQHQEQEQQQQQQQQQEQQQARYDREQQRLEERRHEQEDQEQRDLYQQHLESTAEKLRRELEAMLVADVDRDATFQLKLTSKLDQWHAFHERATRRLPGFADGPGPSTIQPANVHPLEVDQSADATCPSEQAASFHAAEVRTAEAEARAAEGVARGAEGEARAASGEARVAKGVALAVAAAFETREAKAAELENAAVVPKQLEAAAGTREAAYETREAKAADSENATVAPKQLDAAAVAREAADSENATVAPKQLEAAADAREAALEAALQVQREELEAKAVVIQELQVRLHAAATREAGYEATLKLQREELEAKAAEVMAARAAEVADLQQQLDAAISREAAFDASLKLQREELEAKAAEIQDLQERLQEAGIREAAFDASLKLQREELEAKAAEALAAQAGMEERKRVRAAEAAAARLAEVEGRLGEVERERERLARNLGRLQQHLLDRDADEALRLEREAERIRQLECQLADKEKALGQSECERVVLERQLADKASQLGQSERRRVQLEQQLEERSREVREARMQLARLQARAEPAGQTTQMGLRGEGGVVRAEEKQERQGMSRKEALPDVAPGSATCLGTGLATGTVPGVFPDVLRQVLEAAHRPIVARHPMCMHAGMLASEPGVAETGRECEVAALVEENGRLEAERARAEEERARAEERSARADEEMRVLQGNLQEAEALCWQRQAQLEEALSEVTAGRRERGALEEELLRLQCALDQCMLRLNSDSAYMVDRRIVVKLLVAYFQRNRSREVLDIMCRILECSKDERQQLEAAASHPPLTRSASFKSKGSVRQGGSKGGVFGLPGRIAGGLLGASRSSLENSGGAERDSQGQQEVEKNPEARKSGSLTDLWTKLATQVSIPPTAAHVPTAAGNAH